MAAIQDNGDAKLEQQATSVKISAMFTKV